MTRWRMAYLVGGWIMLGLGAVGVALPVLPTTPFLLAAAWLFSRSSPAMTAWLLNHPILGRPLRAWRDEGAISARAKLLAVGSMALGYVVTLRFEPVGHVAIVLAAILLSVAAFIVTRPTPRGPLNCGAGQVCEAPGLRRDAQKCTPHDLDQRWPGEGV